MRVAVVGSRAYSDMRFVFDALDVINAEHTITCIVSGGARGVDTFAERWAHKNKIPTKIYHAKWDTHGKAAGMIRNADIVGDSHLVVAFWDGISKGTKNSIDTAKKRGIPVLVVEV